jgi:hypothetical protein
LIHIKTHRHTKMNTLACDATIIISLGFYFTTLNIYRYIYTHTHKITLHYLGKEKVNYEKERVTPEFGGY